MPIYVAALPELLPSQAFRESGLAIVIDTLRFTTTACQALRYADSLRVSATVEQARKLADGELKLCGERDCRPIAGFHFGNSPLEFTAASVGGAQLLFTTTNGTRAVEAVAGAAQVWLAALVNRRRICQRLAKAEFDNVWLVCSGTDRRIAAEDLLAAGSILDGAGQSPGNDEAQLALAAWQATSQTPGRLQGALELAAGGRNLLAAGYAGDVAFAARVDALDVVPQRGASQVAFVPG